MRVRDVAPLARPAEAGFDARDGCVQDYRMATSVGLLVALSSR